MIGLLCKNLYFQGGLEIVTQRLHEGFISANIKAKIYSLSDLDDSYVKYKRLNNIIRKKLLLRFLEDNVSFVIFELENPYTSLADIKLIRILNANNIKVRIVLHNSPKYFISYYRSFNENTFRYLLRKFKLKLYWKPLALSFVRKAVRYAKFISISNGCRYELKNYFKVDSVVIPNLFVSSHTLYGDYRKEKSLAFIGRMDFKQKNLLFILDSWNSVKDKKDWKLHIIGNGDKKILINYIKTNKIQNIIVEDAKSPEEIIKFLQSNSILLLGSKYEGFPTIILEATSQSNAIISTRYDGFSDEILKDSVNGYVVNFDSKVFSSKIENLINNTELLHSMHNESRKLYENYKKMYNPIDLWKKEFSEIN